jgi:hypothetical protein
MPQDTIPERDAMDDTGTRWDVRASRLRAEVEGLFDDRARAVEQQSKQSATKGISLATVIALVLGVGGGAGGYVAGERADAQRDERVIALEHRVTLSETQLGELGQLRQDFAAMRASVEAWRSMDANARDSASRETDRRLARIEELLDRRR